MVWCFRNVPRHVIGVLTIIDNIVFMIRMKGDVRLWAQLGPNASCPAQLIAQGLMFGLSIHVEQLHSTNRAHVSSALEGQLSPLLMQCIHEFAHNLLLVLLLFSQKNTYAEAELGKQTPPFGRADVIT